MQITKKSQSISVEHDSKDSKTQEIETDEDVTSEDVNNFNFSKMEKQSYNSSIMREKK